MFNSTAKIFLQAKAFLSMVKPLLKQISKATPTGLKNYLTDAKTFAGVENNESLPLWVEKLFQKIRWSVFPNFNPKIWGRFSDKEDGVFWGHIFALAIYIRDNLNSVQIDEKSRVVIKQISKFLLPIIKVRISEAQKCSLKKSADFFEGFSNALSRQSKKEDMLIDINSALPLYFLLIFRWREISKFKSVRELHEWIQQIMGENLAGNQKRTEKICKKIGLKFRSKGRPRKNPPPVA